jgi:NADH dehydrogenase FAD-containing subunit
MSKNGKVTGETVLVLGGSFGGLTAANQLQRQLATGRRFLISYAIK